jgi:hypothetical protein
VWRITGNQTKLVTLGVTKHLKGTRRLVHHTALKHRAKRNGASSGYCKVGNLNVYMEAIFYDLTFGHSLKSKLADAAHTYERHPAWRFAFWVDFATNYTAPKASENPRIFAVNDYLMTRPDWCRFLL